MFYRVAVRRGFSALAASSNMVLNLIAVIMRFFFSLPDLVQLALR
jgi:hypothetical protein